jgi:hypothetical protein
VSSRQAPQRGCATQKATSRALSSEGGLASVGGRAGADPTATWFPVSNKEVG